jgi:hypothetical protein
MASTYSALKIELIATGEQSGTWGTTTNTNLGDAALGEAITGSADVAFSSADVTVTLTDTNATQAARNLRLNLTGTSGGARNLVLGSGCQIEKLYLINNGLADAVTVKNTTGTGIAVAAGKSMFVFNNGTNVVDAVTYATSLTLGSALPIASGGTGSTSTTFVNAATNVTGTLPVVNGGTGRTTNVAYSVVCGGTTTGGVEQSVASVGTSGQVLTSGGAGALPTWTTISAKAFPTGTRMSFQQTAAPTGWTKDTTAAIDNSAMRLVTGSVVNGGTVAFTTAFASQTPAGSVAVTAVSGTAGATTLTTPQIPSHTHTVLFNGAPTSYAQPSAPKNFSANPGNTGSTGGGASHDHPFSFTSGSGTFTGTAINLAVKYYDFIIASID